MTRVERFDFKLILFMLFLCLKCFISCGKIRIVPNDVLSDLYLKYVEAVSDDKTNISSRRLFKNDKQYEIHIKKLKEVNGFKVHNLIVKESLRTDSNPFIYINNPVESKIPKAFLTLEEFKNVLTNRIMKQRDELTNKPKINLNKRKSNKTTRNNPLNITKLKNLAYFNIYKENSVKLMTKIELITSSTVSTVAHEEISNTFTTETVMTKVYTNFRNIVKEEESTQNTKQQLEEPNIETNRFTDEIKVTAGNFDVNEKIGKQAENIPLSSSAIDVKKQLITTTIGNITEEDLETTELDLSSVTDKNTKELETVVDDNKDLLTTDVETLQDETVKVELTTEKEKPKRKSTMKLSVNFEASKKISKQRKRSTLGRPLVFMGKQ